MLAIESIKGRANVMYVLAAVAVLLLVASAVLAYDYSRAAGGGEDASDGAREVVSYDDGKFIDKEGYDGGDAKLIYTVVSNPGTDAAGTVKITDMERDLRSISYTIFPDSVSYNGVTYNVIGNTVTKNADDRLVDEQGVVYTVSDNTATITGYVGDATSASVIFPAKISYNSVEYLVKGVDGTDFQNATISNLTIIVPVFEDSKIRYTLLGTFMRDNKTLTSLKFIVESDCPCGYGDDKSGMVSLQKGPFTGCTSLKELVLPNVLDRSDNAFEGCTSLGSEESGYSSENPFVFNTQIPTTWTSDNMFLGCTGIKYIEFGKNVNKILNFQDSPNNIFSKCNGIKVIYNASSTITEEDIAKCIVNSGSHNVLLFNNPGGTFTKGASITADSDDTISKITMPEGTYSGVDIPSWSHKDGTARFDSGEDYASFNPWGTANTAYSYYYYALYGTCTVTYHVWYKNNNEVISEVQTQTVVCMYNTKLYDGSTYPNEDLRTKFIYQGGTWIVSDSEYGDFAYSFGEALTLHTDLDLIVYFDGVESKDLNITLTIKWDYVNSNKVTTYSKQYTFTGYTYTLPTKEAFCSGMDDALKELVGVRVTEPNGRAYGFGETVKFFCDLTLTVVSSTEAYKLVCYSNKEMNVNRFFLNYTAVNMIVAAPNTFHYNDETQHLTYWSLNSDGSGTKYYPGDLVPYTGSSYPILYAIWESNDSNVSVTYNLYKNGSEYKSVPKTYAYKEILENLPSDSDADFSRQGYKLIGWSYTPTQNVNFPLDVPVNMRSNLRLYAVWEEVPPTVITDNLLVSKENAKGDYVFNSIFIGNLAENDEVQYTVTFLKGENPTEVGVYTVQIGYKVLRNGADVTKEYYSGYDGTNPVTYQCYNAFLTIYSGDHATVTD